jgi:hypothetical protein
VTIPPFEMPARNEDTILLDTGAMFLSGHFVGENTYPVWVERNVRTEERVEAREIWQLRYTPEHHLPQQVFVPAYEHLLLRQEEAKGAPLPNCSTPWIYAAPAASLPLSPRGPASDPPIPAPLKGAISAATEDPTLLSLSELLRSDQAYLQRWTFSAQREMQPASAGSWPLDFTGAMETHDVVVTCTAIGTLSLAWRCNEHTRTRESPAPPFTELPQEIAAYEHPFGFYRAVSGDAICFASWEIGAGRGAAFWISSCDEVRLRFAAVTGDIIDFSGEAAAQRMGG